MNSQDDHNEQLQEIIHELRVLTKENQEMLRSIQRNQRWATFFGVFRILFIVIPIMLAWFYLPPLIKEYTEQFRSIFPSTSEGGEIQLPRGFDFGQLQQLLER